MSDKGYIWDRLATSRPREFGKRSELFYELFKTASDEGLFLKVYIWDCAKKIKAAIVIVDLAFYTEKGINFMQIKLNSHFSDPRILKKYDNQDHVIARVRLLISQSMESVHRDR